MATRNFLFLRVEVNHLIKSLLTVIFAFAFISCQSIDRRHSPPPPTNSSAGTPVNSPPEAKTKSYPVQQPVEPSSALTPASAKVPPIGIFLSPGAMRSFAHVGVLRVLQKAQLPIVAIGGMEWGSVVAALYSLSKSPFEVEWEMMKLKAEQLPTTNLLHRQLSPINVNESAPFLKAAFGEKDLNRANMSFRCPYTDGDQTFFVSRGIVKNQIEKCMAMPPIYSGIEASGKLTFAGSVAPGDWAGELHRAGAQFIIYVDVISKGNILANSGNYSDPQTLRALWYSIKSISKQQHQLANLTIEVPMDYDLGNFDRRREAIAMGEDAAKQALGTTLKAVGMQ
jgi:NTE family protein